VKPLVLPLHFTSFGIKRWRELAKNNLPIFKFLTNYYCVDSRI